jgi:dTDP-6-deoxy-L-talose 4-dehydrogenase (NAD+)
MKILVTGATGFIGSHVVELLLSQGHSVTAVARRDTRLTETSWHGRATFISADIHHPAKLEKLQPGTFDAVMHLAWPGLPNYESLTHLEQTLPAEIAFLKGLVQAGATHILITGTCFEYGLHQGCLSEMIVPDPVTPYAVAKNTIRIYLENLKKEYPFRLQWARLFYTFGRGQNPKSLLALLDSAIERGDASFNMSGGEQLRDYLPVEKIAEHLVALAEHPTFDGIVNVCSGKPISVRKLVEDHIAKRGIAIKLNLGHYPYPEYEPMAFWGDNSKLMKLNPI